MKELTQYIKSYFGIVGPHDLEKLISFFEPTIIKKGEYF
jgi:hypothetical protein